MCYPEHFTKSFLKLYRFSLKDGDYTILGDSIPIYSDKINTNANLYYDKDLNTIYAVVHQFEDDIRSDLHIYSLSFPPITEKELANHPPTGKKSYSWIIYLTMGVILLGAGIVLFRPSRRKRKDIRISDNGNAFNKLNNKQKIQPQSNSIYLFGEFTVCNRDNRDITYMFSKKLKETFCLLLQYSLEKGGITSQHLSRLLWPEKPPQKVKNIRNVTLNRLRKILEELDGIELLYEKGMFTIIQKDPIFCDYTWCMQLLSSNQWKAEYKGLIEIVTRGKFLEEAWQTTIDLAQAAFHIDPLNETALNCMIKSMQKLGMHERVKIKSPLHTLTSYIPPTHT